MACRASQVGHDIICGKRRQNRKTCDHRNSIPAHKPEEWILDTVHHLLESEVTLETPVEKAPADSPRFDAGARSLARHAEGVASEPEQIDEMIGASGNGNVQGRPGS